MPRGWSDPSRLRAVRCPSWVLRAKLSQSRPLFGVGRSRSSRHRAKVSQTSTSSPICPAATRHPRTPRSCRSTAAMRGGRGRGAEAAADEKAAGPSGRGASGSARGTPLAASNQPLKIKRESSGGRREGSKLAAAEGTIDLAELERRRRELAAQLVKCETQVCNLKGPVLPLQTYFAADPCAVEGRLPADRTPRRSSHKPALLV
jgi:hypothetical protein